MADDLTNAFELLRVTLSGDTRQEDQNTQKAVKQLRIVENKIVDLMVDINI